jgi:hypothetical protein
MAENNITASVLVALKTLAFLSNQIMLRSTSIISELVEPLSFRTKSGAAIHQELSSACPVGAMSGSCSRVITPLFPPLAYSAGIEHALEALYAAVGQLSNTFDEEQARRVQNLYFRGVKESRTKDHEREHGRQLLTRRIHWASIAI